VTDDHERERGLTLERFYNIAAEGKRTEIDDALANFPASARLRDPIAIGLRSIKSVVEGDLPGGLALLQRAIPHSEGRVREYLLDFFIPMLYNTRRLDEAQDALDSIEGNAPELASAFLAAQATVAACRGDDTTSARCALAALEHGREVDNPIIVGRTLHRIAMAAVYREDFDEAQDRALEAARLFERIEQHRSAAICYIILYSISHDWADDVDLARYYARRTTMAAHLAEDVGLEHFGVLLQFELAAETGDARRLESIRGRLVANPLNEQYYNERFFSTVAEVLARGWEGRFEAARVALVALRNSESLTMSERSLCDALLAIVAVAMSHVDLARRIVRRTINQTAEPRGHETFVDARSRRVARVLAAAVAIGIGDTIRGRRALSRSFDPEQRLAPIIDANGIDVEQVPAGIRGYAKFLNAACKAANEARPVHSLTEAELEVLKALPAGMTLATIAISLGKSRKTVERQVGAIYAKLHVANRAQAIQRARDLGLHV
jgi:DNA-binding CsgD family transcriptional regulator